MMYMDDAKATLDLMEAPAEKINIRSSYNIASISFAQRDCREIKNIFLNLPLPITLISGKPLPTVGQSIDDSAARNDWGWQHQFGLREMTEEILTNFRNKKLSARFLFADYRTSIRSVNPCE